ncbi:MAG: PadR family transcriptional regulator [Asticcacaulis sp.]|nr:PadR family transcriptional regulator [Asticcacaulis sp.]
MTPLNYALLGLIRSEPRSGYALRKVFETTPLGNYSSSPGSIYPALKHLEKAGLIESRAAGKKSQFFITRRGRTALEAWLTTPVTAEEDRGVALLRFAFLQDHPDRGVTLEFLLSFARAAHDQIVGLKTFMASDAYRTMPLQSRLAVQHGLMGTEASARWAAEAYKQLSEELRHEVHKSPA